MESSDATPSANPLAPSEHGHDISTLPLSSERPCFRLLEIDAATDGGLEEALVGTAATYDLPCGFEYDALSYCWGKSDESEIITLNGDEFPISHNLAAALRQFRAEQKQHGGPGTGSASGSSSAAAARKLWVDAVCINQRDNAEKSHQVTRMRDIYANAHRVFAWLGEADEFSALAIETLRQFANNTITTTTTTTTTPTGSAEGNKDQQEPAEGTLAERQRAAIRAFVQRPYFFRMWIVQEVVAAKEVTLFWGPDSLDFDAACVGLERATGAGFYAFSQETANLTYVRRWREAFHTGAAGGGGGGDDDAEQDVGAKYVGDDEDLDLRLFLDSRDRSATDPRDKIYALRGIARGRISRGIRVDYDDPVRKVYADFSRHVLRVRPDLQVLSAVVVRHASISAHSLPSYVPDWSLPKFGGGFLQRYYRFKPTHLFRASGDTTPRVEVAADLRVGVGGEAISIEGVRLDTIARVIPIKSLLAGAAGGTAGGTAGSTTVVTEAVLRDLAADALPCTDDAAATTYGFTGEPTWVAYFRTLTADRTALSPRISEGYRSNNFARFSSLVVHDSAVASAAAAAAAAGGKNKTPWAPAAAATDDGEDGNDSSLPDELWEDISRAVETIVEDKDMFVTERGYLGLGHESCEVGDLVCIFSGGEVPFLVRARGSAVEAEAEQPVAGDGGGAGADADAEASSRKPSLGYTFLGECYVHGVMDGEAMDGSRALERFLLV